jgi:hypothetical protein
VKASRLKNTDTKKLFVTIFLGTSVVSCGSGGGMHVNPSPKQSELVQVSSPANNSTVGTTVNYAAKASTTCASGVDSMGIYTAPGELAYKVKGSALNTNLSLNPATYNTTVQSWDNCGGTAATPVTIKVSSAAPPASGGSSPTSGNSSTNSGSAVNSGNTPALPGNTFADLHQKSGWTGYVLLPPSYSICSSCSVNGPQTTLSMKQGVSSPSLSGNATQFSLGGQTQFSDGLWNDHLIGDFSSQGNPDGDHKITPAVHNFIYDVFFYSDNISASQALEFDINQFVNGQSYIWGHECRIAGGNEWDIWDNQGQKWHPTGVACNPKNNDWNHLTIQVQRTSDGHLLFQSITLNGNTSTLNYYESPTSAGWYGITVNYQMDGNAAQEPYSVWLDNLSFNYW